MMVVCVCVCVCVCVGDCRQGRYRRPLEMLPGCFCLLPGSCLFLETERRSGGGGEEEEEEEEEWEDSYQNLTSCFHGFGNRSVGT